MFTDYLSFGGTEIANTNRLRGYAETAGCRAFWIKGDLCENLRLALDHALPYTHETIDQAPWYDPSQQDLSSRFYGVMVVDADGIQNSSRHIATTEGIVEGGTIGSARRAMKKARFKVMLLAEGDDALDYGIAWLSSALDADKCGQHGGRCGVTDLEFFTTCPEEVSEVYAGDALIPDTPEHIIEDLREQSTDLEPIVNYAPEIKGDETWRVRARNLFTNPNLVGDGTWAEVRRNYVKNPAALASGIAAAEWFGDVTYRTYGSGAPQENGRTFFVIRTDQSIGEIDEIHYTRLTGLTQGREYHVRFWAHAPLDITVPENDYSWDWGVNYPTVSPASSWPYRFEVTEGNTASVHTATFTALYDEMYLTFTPKVRNLPSPGNQVLYFDQVMVTELSGTGSELDYFDGSTTPETAGGVIQPEDFRWRWLGTPNASESVMEIERVAGLNNAGGAIPGVSTQGGKPAVRVIPLGDPSSGTPFVFFNIPTEARAGGTVVGTLHIQNELTGTFPVNTRRLGAYDPIQLSDVSPNIPGVYDHRHTYGALTSIYRAVFYAGARIGGGDVWWTDIGLFAGDYDGPAFSGDTEPERPEWRYSWEGEPNNSVSVWEEKGTWATVYENLFTNPRLKGDGTWAEVRRNLIRAPRGTATREGNWNQRGTRTTALTGGPAHCPQWGRLVVETPGGSATYWSAGTGTNAHPIEPGRPFEVGYSSYTTAEGTSRAGLYFYDESGNYLETQNTPLPSQEYTPGEWFTRTGWVSSPPANAHYVLIEARITATLEVGDVIGWTACHISYVPGGYLDGDYSGDPDMRSRWLGAENSSESVMEGERARGFTSNAHVASIVSERGGLPAVRVVRLSDNDSAYSTSGGAYGSPSFTGVLSIWREGADDVPYSNSATDFERASGDWEGTTLIPTAELPPPGTWKSFKRTRDFATSNARFLMRPPLGVGRSFWYTSPGLYAGNYPYEAFNGDSDPADAGIEQPEDFRIRWTGQPDASTSVMEGETVADVTTTVGGVAYILSTLENRVAGRAIRLPYATSTPQITFANSPYREDGYTGGVTVYRTAPGPLATSIAVQNNGAPWGSAHIFNSNTLPGVGEIATNFAHFISSEEGVGSRLRFTTLNEVGQSLWFQDPMLIAGEYSGPAFNADTGWFQVDNAWYYATEGADGLTTAYPGRAIFTYPTDDIKRFMHDVATSSGPLMVQKMKSGPHRGALMEFTITSERGYIYTSPRELNLAAAELSAAADEDVNLVMDPAYEHVTAATVIAGYNLATNPSVETNTTNWFAVAGAGSRVNTVSAYGDWSFQNQSTSSAASFSNQISYVQDLASVPGYGAGPGNLEKLNIGIWGAISTVSGPAQPDSLEVSIVLGGPTILLEKITDPALFGGYYFLNEVEVPPGWTGLLEIMLVARYSNSGSSTVRLFGDGVFIGVGGA